MNLNVFLSGLIALALFSSCEKKADLKTDEGRASYAIGQQIGQNLVQQKIDIDINTLTAALKDAKANKNQMTKEEIQEAMMKLQEMAMKKQSEEGEKNKKASADFLEKNKTTSGVQVTPSGLQYIAEKKGEGAAPKKTDTVKVHYKGTLITGEQFDSSYERNQPAEFPVEAVIAGWTEALQLMPVGSKYKLFIPAELAYGASGRPGIPPNSALIFEVELLDIVKEQAASADKAKEVSVKTETKKKK